MIICTGCGTKNDDESRHCEKCGKKLQSSRAAYVPEEPKKQPLGQFLHKGVSKDSQNSLKRMIEAWAYIMLLGGVFAACLHYEIWWPLYPAVGVIGLIIWARKV